MEIKTMELKKIRLFAAMSEETNCYMGTVYINGKPAIDVKNDGHGGCDMQYPINGNDRKIIEAANEFCKKNFAATVFLFGGLTKDNFKQKDILYSNLEIWCGDQIQASEVKKNIKKLTTNKVAFVGKDRQVYSYSSKGRNEAEIVAHIRSKHGDVLILNELTLEQQIKALDVQTSNSFVLTPEEAAKVPA